MFLLVLIGLTVVPQVTIKPAEQGVIIAETESAYNYIRVIELEDGTHLLELNEGQATHSIYHPERLLTSGPWDYYLVAPYFAPGVVPSDLKRVLMIGLGAGTVPKQITQIYGPIEIVGVEIDPRIVEIGRQYFDMTEPNLEVVVQDGRYFLMTDDRKYDMIGTDAYQQPYIPFQMTTLEYFQHVRDRLTPNGVAVINVGRTSTDFRLVHTIAGTMKSVFPNVYIIDIPGTINSIVVATNQPSSPQNFLENIQPLLASQDIDDRLRVGACGCIGALPRINHRGDPNLYRRSGSGRAIDSHYDSRHRAGGIEGRRPYQSQLLPSALTHAPFPVLNQKS